MSSIFIIFISPIKLINSTYKSRTKEITFKSYACHGSLVLRTCKLTLTMGPLHAVQTCCEFTSPRFSSGGQLGIALQLLASGFLANSFGWAAIFYTNGTLGAIWTIAYLVFGSACPEQSKLISKEELHYIQRSLGRDGEQVVRRRFIILQTQYLLILIRRLQVQSSSIIIVQFNKLDLFRLYKTYTTFIKYLYFIKRFQILWMKRTAIVLLIVST